MHGNDEKAKTPSQRASSDDAFRQRARSLFFLLCAQAHVNTYFFLFFYVYVCVAYTARPKTKGKRDLSFSYSYIYLRNKSHHGIFFDESDKPDRKSLRQATHGVRKQGKKRKKLILYMITQQKKKKDFLKSTIS